MSSQEFSPYDSGFSDNEHNAANLFPRKSLFYNRYSYSPSSDPETPGPTYTPATARGERNNTTYQTTLLSIQPPNHDCKGNSSGITGKDHDNGCVNSSGSDGDIEATQLMNNQFKSYMKNDLFLSSSKKPSNSDVALQNSISDITADTESYNLNNSYLVHSGNSAMPATQFSDSHLLTKSLFGENTSPLQIVGSINRSSNVDSKYTQEYSYSTNSRNNANLYDRKQLKKRADFTANNNTIIMETQLTLEDHGVSTEFIAETQLPEPEHEPEPKNEPDPEPKLGLELELQDKIEIDVDVDVEPESEPAPEPAGPSLLSFQKFKNAINLESVSKTKTHSSISDLEPESTAKTTLSFFSPRANGEEIKARNDTKVKNINQLQALNFAISQAETGTGTGTESRIATVKEHTQTIDFDFRICSPNNIPLSAQKSSIYTPVKKKIQNPLPPILSTDHDENMDNAIIGDDLIQPPSPDNINVDFDIVESDTQPESEDIGASSRTKSYSSELQGKSFVNGYRDYKSLSSASTKNATTVQLSDKLDLFEVKIGAVIENIKLQNISRQASEDSKNRPLIKKQKRKLFDMNNKPKLGRSVHSFDKTLDKPQNSVEYINKTEFSIFANIDGLKPKNSLNFCPAEPANKANDSANLDTPRRTPRNQQIIIPTSVGSKSSSRSKGRRISTGLLDSSSENGQWVWISNPGNNSMYSPAFLKNPSAVSPIYPKSLFGDKPKSSEKRGESRNTFNVFNERGNVQKLVLKSTLIPKFKHLIQGDRVWAIRKRKRNAETGSIVSINLLSTPVLDLVDGKSAKKIQKADIPHITIQFDKDCEQQPIPVYKIHSTATLLNWVVTPQRQSTVTERETLRHTNLIGFFGKNSSRNHKEPLTPSRSKNPTSRPGLPQILNNPRLNNKLFLGLSFLVTFSPLLSKGSSKSKNSSFNLKDAASIKSAFFPSLGTGELDRKQFELYISSFGGTVFNSPAELEGYLNSDRSKVYILSDSPSATFKYLYGLACGLPLISLSWVFECIKANSFLDPRMFTLANGWSYELNTACASPPIKDFMKGYAIMLCGSRQFKDNWKALLTLVGAEVIPSPNFLVADQSQDLTQGQDLSLNPRKNEKICDYILSEYSTDLIWRSQISILYQRSQKNMTNQSYDANTKISFEQSHKEKMAPRFVSSQWAKQCLINRRALAYDGHTSYTTFFKKKSNSLRSLIKQVD